jgi:hypothetical protein
VGCSGAARALDRGWEVAEAAVDGELRQQWGSGEVWSSGKGKTVEMQVRESKSGFVGAPGHAQGPEEGTATREQLLATGGMRGGSGGGGVMWRSEGGPARGGEWRRGCWDGTWRRGKRCGAAGAWHMAGENGGGGAERKTEQGTRGRRRGTDL